MQVNQSSYYQHFRPKPAPRTQENQYIASIILHIYSECNKRLDANKISYLLQRDYGIHISIGRIYRLMKKLQLPKISTEKPKHHITHSDNGECRNHLCQDFNQKTPNLVWVSDITYIKAGGKWYYLSIVMDLFSRKIIAWHLSGKADTDLVITTFQKTYQKRNAPYGLMFHSHRGSQYTASAFQQLLDTLNIVQSFSKKGYPFDNAICECFFKYLKKEETSRRIYHTLEELHPSIFEYIEGFYNSRRPHSSLGLLTPNEKENLYWEQH